MTTAYYLTLKRFIRSGGKSIADITKYNPHMVQKLIEQEHVKQQQKASEDNYIAEIKKETGKLNIQKTKPADNFTIKLVNKQSDISGLQQI